MDFLPSYVAFAAGFVLWGASTAMTSGSVEALVYDEFAAAGATDRYVRTVGVAQTAALVAELAAMALAAPAYAFGGYLLVGVASIAVTLAAVPVALSFPEAPPVEQTGARFVLTPCGRGSTPTRDVAEESPDLASLATSRFENSRMAVYSMNVGGSR